MSNKLTCECKDGQLGGDLPHVYVRSIFHLVVITKFVSVHTLAELLTENVATSLD
jgi:hypothetical protein